MYQKKNNQNVLIRCPVSRVVCFLLLASCLLLPALLSAQNKIVYDDQGKRDPFIALVTPDGRLLNLEPLGPDSKIALEGIIFDESGRSYAIINKQIVSVGDCILGQVVFKIEEDKVILQKDNQPVEYKIDKEE